MKATGERDRVLRQVLRLVDLSGDLDRNRSDSDFADAGGHLLRVVDQNIFEMFVRPSHHREAVETFYAPLWAPGERANAEWRSFEAQAALITAEFILSERTSPVIFMSDHHRWELAHRVEALTTEIRTEVDKKRKAARRELTAKLEIGSDLERGRLERAAGFASGQKLTSLTADLKGLAHAPQAVLDRFQMARVSAAFLADNQLIEPLDQLRRAVSSEMRSRLNSIQAQYRLSRSEAQVVETDADRWYDRLALELRRPGHHRRLRTQRPIDKDHARERMGQALRNDARTIAFLQWVARHKIELGQRLVFITGDTLLFDAYRRWHVENEAVGRPPQPFVLRRATQYSPIFNPTDSGGDLSVSSRNGFNKSGLFTLIQAAIEAALLPLPFTIDMKSRSRLDSSLNLTRERLGLKLVDSDLPSQDKELRGLTDLLSPGWVKDRAAEIENIRESWQRAQRFAIGASTELLLPRIGKELKQTAAHYFETAKDTGKFLREYVTSVLDKLVDDSIQLWVPLAKGFDLGQFDTDPKSSVFAIRFAAALSLGRSVEADAKPVSVFSRAACRALEIQDAASANRFASLARRANRIPEIRGDSLESPDETDLLYLHAVTYRYSISTVDNHFKRSRSDKRRSQLIASGVEQAKTFYGQASQLVDKCLAAHSTDIADPIDQEQLRSAQVRYLRALSERAALHLFMATSLGLAAQMEAAPLFDDYRDYLEYARGDLWRCIKFDAFDESYDAVLELVRAQYIPNLAAYDVLAYVLADDANFDMQPWPRKSRRRIKDVWHNSAGLHSLLAAELVCYFILSDDREGIKLSATKRPRVRDQRELKLPLDRELYRAIYRNIGKPMPRY